MNLTKRFAAVGSIALFAFAGSAMATTIDYGVFLPSPGATGSNDAPLTSASPAPGFFMGRGNDSGNFTVLTDTATNIQLGLKADTAFTGPELEVNQSGNYAEADTTKHGSGNNRAAWDFYFSVNTQSGGGSATLNAYDYSLAVTDLATGISHSYDPINLANDDAGFGPGGVTQGDAYTGPTVPAIALDPSTQWVAQNAENIGFNFEFGGGFTPTDAYQVTLSVFSKGTSTVVDSESITVNAPEPGTVALMLGSLGVLAFMVRRRRTN